ncbi:MAG TPA: PQQ-binding-like beta-propeller repeat protein, partial [Dyadobacter sp.]|nr:PQQ-binding-like beta-propeller repeat protein [Dyadobacter sp.]
MKINNFRFIGIATVALLLMVFFFMVSGRHQESEEDWNHYGHDASNSKFSALSQINTQNVKSLKQIWSYQDGIGGSSVLFNPLIVKGRMYSFLPSDKLAAIDAATGKLIWEFKMDSTDVSTWTRGVTFHPGSNGRPDALLFVYGATLYSINADNGALIREFGDEGRVDFYTGLSVADSMRSRVHVTANAPGVVFGNLFIVGCKVPDELPSISGDVRAFNVNTGKLEWVFHTIPREGEFGYTTWPKNARGKNGGANCWGGMALDKNLGIVYVPTASPSFDFYGADREGQNLFANCLLALDAKTGKRLWHFQTTHHDLWDRDNGSPPNLVQFKQKGKLVDGVALATKMGYVFVFDRKTGKPLFPIKEVPVPTKSDMPGEKPWPTQPIPTSPAPFVRQGFKPEYYSTVTPEVTQYIKDQIKEHQYDTGIYEPPSLRGSLIVPAAHG